MARHARSTIRPERLEESVVGGVDLAGRVERSQPPARIGKAFTRREPARNRSGGDLHIGWPWRHHRLSIHRREPRRRCSRHALCAGGTDNKHSNRQRHKGRPDRHPRQPSTWVGRRESIHTLPRANEDRPYPSSQMTGSPANRRRAEPKPRTPPPDERNLLEGQSASPAGPSASAT